MELGLRQALKKINSKLTLYCCVVEYSEMHTELRVQNHTNPAHLQLLIQMLYNLQHTHTHARAH